MYIQLACQSLVIKCIDFTLGKILFPYSLPLTSVIWHVLLSPELLLYFLLFTVCLDLKKFFLHELGYR